jgi:hypothetical protein
MNENKNIEGTQNNIESLLLTLQEIAIHDDVYSEYTQKMNQIVTSLDQGVYVSKEERDDLAKMRNNIKESTLYLGNLNDFQEAVNLYFSVKEEAEEILAHENSHMNVAESMKVDASYAITITRTTGGFGFYPAVIITKFPEEMNYKQQVEAFIKIASAPDAYSEENSDGDNHQVAVYCEILQALNEKETLK